MNYVIETIGKLLRGQKLRHAGEYWCLFWSQFDPTNCEFCNSARNRARPNCGKDAAARDICKNIDAGKCMGMCAERGQKTQLLQAMAAINFSKPDYSTRRDRREAFNKHWSLDAIAGLTCFICGEPAHHRHHIIQLQHGGRNCRKNQVPLCRGCHREVHR